MKPIQIQLTIAADPQAVYRALTDTASLETWFAEHADVSVADGRYAFWGRFTPGTPDEAAGQNAVRAAEPGRRLAFGWHVLGADTTVDIRLLPRAEHTLLVLRHHNLPRDSDDSPSGVDDFWFLALENLRRHLDGRPVTHCDFTAAGQGDIELSLDIEAPPEAVFDALINPRQLERWIASQATVEPREGGLYEFGWGMGNPHKILELVPNERLVYSWPDPMGEAVSVVTWTLEESGGRTRLTLVQSGFAPETGQPDGLYSGWLNFMSWIRSLVEYGPSWQPPVPRLSPAMFPFYSKAITAQQADLEPEDAEA